MRYPSRPNLARAGLLPPDTFHQKVVIELACTIMTQWRLDDPTQFKLAGLESRFEFQLWKQKAFTALSADVYVRLTALVELNRLLKHACLSAEQAIAWLKAENPAFDLESPLDHMLRHGLAGIREVCGILYSSEHKCHHPSTLHPPPSTLH